MPADLATSSRFAAFEPRPRIVVGCFGLDQHEAGALVAAAALRDAGADVIYLGRFALPDQFVRAALQEDADVIGVSCHSWEYRGYTPELLAAVAGAGLDVAVVLGGSILTATDESQLLDAGVAAVFGPATTNLDIVDGVGDVVAARRRRLAVAAG